MWDVAAFADAAAIIDRNADSGSGAVFHNRSISLCAALAFRGARYDVRASDTSVEIGGFGFLPQLARGEFLPNHADHAPADRWSAYLSLASTCGAWFTGSN